MLLRRLPTVLLQVGIWTTKGRFATFTQTPYRAGINLAIMTRIRGSFAIPALRTGYEMNNEEQQFLNDLDRQLWNAADRLRSNVNPSDYMHVVLGLVFLKYISDAFKERRT